MMFVSENEIITTSETDISNDTTPQTLSKVGKWAADDCSNNCANCDDQFTLINRKHHCRSCGRLLCSSCCSKKLLIPLDRYVQPQQSTIANLNVFMSSADVSYNTPQRCCDSCSKSLIPLQEELRDLNCRANNTLDVDRQSTNRYLNMPVSRKLETDIKKATNTLYNFGSDSFQGEDTIPSHLITSAKGIAFITILKAGFLFSGRIGTGLVMSRLDDGTWSAPSALMMTGFGWGFQAGIEATDVVLILNTEAAVQVFSSKAQFSVGTELAVSLGPVGRSAASDIHGSGGKGTSAAFSYAHSKGLYFGISLEASVFATRDDINSNFYGEDVTPAKLLSGEHARPKAAEPLYNALYEITGPSVESRMDFGDIYYRRNSEYENETEDNIYADEVKL